MLPSNIAPPRPFLNAFHVIPGPPTLYSSSARIVREAIELQRDFMSGQDILGQDEIDALMRGMQAGAIADTPPELR
jgi:hypothetical protein